jgi:integration host factor subunit beta|tara:strand:+ start:158 stop:496 length:339 start_codon:yes stop_codon:yes gene_type:complete
MHLTLNRLEVMMTYTKRDIVRRVAEANGEPMIKVEPWIDSVIVAIREIMMSANTECRIEIRDFGVFEVKKTKAKPKARNPKTNEVIYVPAHRKTHFKPSKLLKSFLRQPLED